jgi:hypothetical protein
MENGIVRIRGKDYQTVAFRVQRFREKYPEWSIMTEILHRDAEEVVVRAVISDFACRIIATGHAEEQRKSSQVNRTSALENAETSAIGRALAAAGFGGTEFASANEMRKAIDQQEDQEGERIKHIQDRIIAAGLDLQRVEAWLSRCTRGRVTRVEDIDSDELIDVVEKNLAKWELEAKKNGEMAEAIQNELEGRK